MDEWGKESKWGNWWDKNKPNLSKIDWSKLKGFNLMDILGIKRNKDVKWWVGRDGKGSGNRGPVNISN